MLTSRANGTSVFVLPNEVESAYAYKPSVSIQTGWGTALSQRDSDSR